MMNWSLMIRKVTLSMQRSAAPLAFDLGVNSNDDVPLSLSLQTSHSCVHIILRLLMTKGCSFYVSKRLAREVWNTVSA